MIMDPATGVGPHLECPARGQPGQGTLGLQARQAKRCSCRQGRKTCTATTGTVVSRLRTGAEPVVRVMTWLAPGCPPQAMVAAGGLDARPVADGLARAGRPGPAVHASRVEPPRDRGPGHAAASRGQNPGGLVWLALAMMVRTRVWRAGEGSAHRAMTLRRRRIERVRRGAAPRPLWVCSAGVNPAGRAIRETCRDPVRTGAQGRPRRPSWTTVGLAHVVKRAAPRRVIDGERRLVKGTPARVERRRRRAQGPGVRNTAASERRHATCRARLAALTRGEAGPWPGARGHGRTGGRWSGPSRTCARRTTVCARLVRPQLLPWPQRGRITVGPSRPGGRVTSRPRVARPPSGVGVPHQPGTSWLSGGARDHAFVGSYPHSHH
jgi:hypothetical protein